jgi:hypothetical protein
MIKVTYMPELSRKDLLRHLTASGRSVTARQLERWWKDDKIARPIRKHVPGIRGSVSLFPTEAYKQAAAMFDASRQNKHGGPGDRRLQMRSFSLWWAGEPVAGNPRDLMLEAMAPMPKALDRIRNEERTLVVGEMMGERERAEDSEDIAFDIADAFMTRHANEAVCGPVTQRLYKNLERQHDDFLSVATALLTIGLGGRLPLERSMFTGERSLAALILKAIGADAFSKMQEDARIPATSAQEHSNDEKQIDEVFEVAQITFDRDKLKAFIAGLQDKELDAAHRYARVFLEDVPIILEAWEVLFGKNKLAATLRVLGKLPTQFRACVVVSIALIIRLHGNAGCEMLAESVKQTRPQAEMLCALAKAFPKYRKLLLTRNLPRLQALAEDQRQAMWESIKPLVPPELS